MMVRGDGLGEEVMWLQCKALDCLRRGKIKRREFPPCAETKSKAASEGARTTRFGPWENQFRHGVENLFHGPFAVSHAQFIICVVR